MTARSRILLVADVFPPEHGGSGRWMWEMYRDLPGFDVDVAAPAIGETTAFDRGSPMPIHRVPLRMPGWGVASPRGVARYWRAFGAVDRIARRAGADVVHCGKCLPEGLVALGLRRRRGLPYWCYAHGEELTLAATSRELRALTSLVLRKAAGVIANSQFTRQLLLDAWAVPPARVVVLHPGVDATRFVPAPPDAAVRDRLGWTNRRVVLTVGALQKRKGQDMLIRALPAVRRTCPDVLYAMSGEGWERDGLVRVARDLGVEDLVQFRGTTGEDDLVELYQQCDLFALPNRQVGWDVEGFGIVLLEAQACGKPVVAGRSGGTSDALADGVTGVLVDATTPDTLGGIVAGLLSDPDRLRTMGSRARDLAAGFDWPVLRRRAADLFARI